MKKLIKIITLTLLALTATLCFAACGEKAPEVDPSGEQSKIVFDKSSVTVVLGDTTDLSYSEVGTVSGSEEWISSSPEFVSINDKGEITGLKLTETPVTITLKKGGLTDTCKVSVALNGLLPSTTSSALPVENGVFALATTVGKSIDLGMAVNFNGKTYDDAEFTYTVDNPSFGSVSNGVFTAGDDVGNCEITVTGKWRDITGPELIATIKVTIHNEYVVSLNDGADANDITLYTASAFCGQSYENCIAMDVTVKENGKALPDDKVQIVYDEVSDLVEYKNGKLYGIRPGSGNVIVKFTDSDGKVNTHYIPLTVIQPVAIYDKTVEYFSAVDGDLGIAYSELFDTYEEGKSVITAFEGTRELTVKDGRILGVTDSSKGKRETTITVYVDGAGYEISLNVYTKVIKTAEDLSFFKMGRALKKDELTDVLYVNLNTKDVYRYGSDTKLGTGVSASDNSLTFNGEVISVFKTSGGSFYEYKTFNGYYIVANDIDATGYTLQRSNEYGSNSYSSAAVIHTDWCGLQGTFDGNGKIISNLSVGSQQGIFGNVGKKGVIKNVAFTDVKFTGKDDNTGLLAGVFCGELKNCYIQSAKLAEGKKNVGLVAGAMHSAATISKSVFKLDAKADANLHYGVLAGEHNLYSTGNISKIECVVISDLPLIVNTVNKWGDKVGGKWVAKGEEADNSANVYQAVNVTRCANVAAFGESLRSQFVTQSDSVANTMWNRIFSDIQI